MNKNALIKRDSSRTAIKRSLVSSKKSESFDEAELESHLQLLSSLWLQFCQAQDEVEFACGTDTLTQQESEREQGEDWYRQALANFTRALKKSHAANQDLSQSQSLPTKDKVQARAEVKLPSIPLPHFSGDPKEWRQFRDAFEAIIHSESSLNGSQKLHYLRCSLQGEALLVVKGFPFTENNYEEAWKLLNKRYDIQRIIVDSHFRALFALKKLNVESSSALKALLDATQQQLHSLKAIGRPVTNWDDWLVHLTVSKLDAETHKQWELSQTDEVSNFDTLVSFIETRCRSLDAIDSHHQASDSSFKSQQSSRSKSKSGASSLFVAAQSDQVHQRSIIKSQPITCFFCSSKHKLYSCDKFHSLDISRRLSFVQEKKLCTNCLAPGHSNDKCRSKNTCRVCQTNHHTLLHQEAQATYPGPSTSNQFMTSYLTRTAHQVLLGTALIKVVDHCGRYQPARLLFDNGSHLSFIRESFAQRLKLKRLPTSATIEGIGGAAAGSSKGEMELTVASVDHSFTTSIRVQILQKITNVLPPAKLHRTEWSHLSRLSLADPHFHTPAEIDILLGSDELGQFLQSGLVKGPVGSPIAQQSTLGWILFGKVIGKASSTSNTPNATCMYSDVSLTKAISKFWEIESLPEIKHLTIEERMCEKHFENTHYRLENGRFVVKLPFKNDCPLGDSRSTAVRALLRMEKLFARDEQLRTQYKNFIREFEQLGHMEKVSHIPMPGRHFYMPHRAVIKESSTTTKLRVVFNASCRTTTGFSLNDTQMIGPQLQPELFHALIRLRSYRYAMSADVAKMYRQVRINDEHLDYQRIVWRDSPQDPIEDYRILTVTYGIASSSHLAVKCVQQTALDEGKNHPAATQVILNHFYMDDLLTGSYEEDVLYRLQSEVSTILRHGGFCLRKWSTNSPLVINSIPEDQREVLQSVNLTEADCVRTLGLQWEPSSDNLAFTVQVNEVYNSKLTKRSLLSEASKLFDPLGLLSPCTIIPKMLFQQLWKPKVDWDEVVPDDIRRRWFHYRDHITSLAAIKVPRWVGTGIPSAVIDLHGFADASQAAYAAAVYLRTVSPDGHVSVHLLAAKTRVAPMKSTTLSLPRLELCGAVLLTQLIKHILPTLEFEVQNVFGWTDSSVTLAWVRQEPGKWCTFVSNRVSQIQKVIEAGSWFHVQSSQNPADCATRGVLPHHLADHPLWWHGPHWLSHNPSSWPPQQMFTTNLEQHAEAVHLVNTQQPAPAWDLIDRYSSLGKLKRITAYVLRFVHNLHVSVSIRKGTNIASFRGHKHLQLSELNEALVIYVRLAQECFFYDELQRLKSNQPVKCTSKLLRMRPFLDNKGLLRVGGRLRNSSFLPDRRYPLLLPATARITTLICEDIHRITLHSGPQAMQAMLHSRFWVIGARNVLRKTFGLCVRCRRHSRVIQQQLMGDLPKPRVEACRPFQRSAVDFAGPVQLRFSKGRGSKATKGYISVFICMATGAMHLELASDLSSSTFIAVFKRFVSRRGHCKELYSDNGTNFVGAERELNDLLSQARKDETLARYIADDGTTWHFNPPASPHMGGYWEAAVKRVKYHLRRTVGDKLLTYEEYYTFLAEIEACVNSRPLCPISSNVNDLMVLTPGHFLIGEPLKTIPEPDVTSFEGNLVDRWQLISNLRQHFWRRWSSEYLVQLQQRSKWILPKVNFQIGDLVAIRDERLPPTKWKLGRVIIIHKGKDDKVRVVTLKTADGLLTRPIVKLSPLLKFQDQPINNST